MNKVLIGIMVAVSLLAGLALAADRPRVGTLPSSENPSKPQVVQQDAGDRVIDIFSAHSVWERNKVKIPGVFRADKAQMGVRADGGVFKFFPGKNYDTAEKTFTVKDAREFQVIGPVQAGPPGEGGTLPTYTFRLRFIADPSSSSEDKRSGKYGHRTDGSRNGYLGGEDEDRSQDQESDDNDYYRSSKKSRRHDEQASSRGGKTRPAAERLFDAKLLDWKGRWVLVLSDPGATDYTEEWVLWK